MDAPKLGARAAVLATELNHLTEQVGHELITADLTNISGEMALLSTTLCRLHEAMIANESAYTAAFRQDLEEITNELYLIFEEVEECSVQLQKADPSSYNSVRWFFRKGRATRLQSHLEALKSTIIVIRTVLHHGKDYGTQTSPGRLAESTAHTMSEDRAILESIFAKNRNAITDLHNLNMSHSHNHSSSTSSDLSPGLSPGAHDRNFSFATGVDTISVPGVLPPRDTPTKERVNAGGGLARRFSKRVGLDIHKSIMQTKAAETEATLRKRWVKTNIAKPMPSIAEASATVTLKENDMTDTQATRNTSDSASSRSRSNSLALIGSSVGKSLSRAIRGLSLGHKPNIKPKGSKDVNFGGVLNDPGEQHVSGSQEKPGPVTALKLKLSKPNLRTPDYNEDFENGV